MKNIIWIDSNPLIGKLVENIGKAQNFKAYHLDNSEVDFSYLINDLNPEVIVIDEINWQKNQNIIEQSLLSSAFKGQLVFIGLNAQDPKFNLFFKKPINPFEVIESLKK